MSPIGSITTNYLQSILTTALQGTGLTSKANANSNTNSTSQVASQPDNTQLSPFAQMLSQLQQLQQTDPAKYQTVTQQISTNLTAAANTAQANGNTQAATQLNQLATDFSNASQNGQLPNVQDLAQAAAGGHHHHHHMHSSSSGSDSSSSTSSSSSSTSNSQQLSQLLAAFQSSAGQSNALDPTSIILSTLSQAGISSPTS